MHLFQNLQYPFYPDQVGAYLGNTVCEPGIHPDWDASPSQDTMQTHIHTPRGNLVNNPSGREETKERRGNPKETQEEHVKID